MEVSQQNSPLPIRAKISPLWTVLAGALGCAVGAGIVVIYVFPIFSVAFAAEFHWDRSAYSYCLTSFLVATGFGTVILGFAISRWGVRYPAVGFVVVFASIIAAIGVLPPSLPAFCAAFAFLGVAGAAATAMPYAVAISGWFDRNRGLALGIVNTGAGFGAALAPQYARYLVAHHDWRTSFFIVAFVVAAIAVPGLAILVRDPPGVTSPRSTALTVTAGFRRELPFLRDSSFWFIGLLILALSIATFGVMGSLVPFLKDHNIAGGTVADVLSIAGIASWIGRLLTGYLLDRVFAPHLAAAVVCCALLGLGLLVQGGADISISAGAALVGATLGAEGDLVAFMVSRYFSLASFSKVVGAMWVMWAWGGGIGSYMAGTIFRAMNSYNLAFGLFAILLAAAGLGICRIGAYRFPREQRP